MKLSDKITTCAFLVAVFVGCNKFQEVGDSIDISENEIKTGKVDRDPTKYPEIDITETLIGALVGINPHHLRDKEAFVEDVECSFGQYVSDEFRSVSHNLHAMPYFLKMGDEYDNDGLAYSQEDKNTTLVMFQKHAEAAELYGDRASKCNPVTAALNFAFGQES